MNAPKSSPPASSPPVGCDKEPSTKSGLPNAPASVSHASSGSTRPRRPSELASVSHASEGTSCEQCGKRFVKRRPDHRFCSTGCRDDYWNSPKRAARKEIRERWPELEKAIMHGDLDAARRHVVHLRRALEAQSLLTRPAAEVAVPIRVEKSHRTRARQRQASPKETRSTPRQSRRVAESARLPAAAGGRACLLAYPCAHEI